MQAVAEPATAGGGVAPAPAPTAEEVPGQAGRMACGHQAGHSDTEETLCLRPFPLPKGSLARLHAPHGEEKGNKGTPVASNAAC